MSDIDAVQGRIMAALDRIGQGLDALSADSGETSSEETRKLQQNLEDEKLANAQLKERVKTLRARLEKAETAASVDAGAQDAHAEALRKLDADLQALRHVNQQLRDNNAALREANATGVVEPHLINKAMMAELEGLRAVRASDRTEVDAVLAELDKVVRAATQESAPVEDGEKTAEPAAQEDE